MSLRRDEVQRGTLLVVAGPSGVGKSSVVSRALELDRKIWLSVSATTRSPREGERDGVQYLFLTMAEFNNLAEADGFLEWAEFAGNRYGTPAEPVAARLDAGQSVLLEIDVQGVRLVKDRLPEARTVFIAPPSEAELRARLVSRGTESAESLDRRIAAAEAELAAQDEFDHVIVNREIDQAARELLAWAGEAG